MGHNFKDNVFAQVQRYFSGEATLPRDAALLFTISVFVPVMAYHYN